MTACRASPSRRKTWPRRHLAAALAAGFAAACAYVAPARPAPLELKCASQLPLDHPAGVRLTQMWTAVERESGGRLRVRYFPNSQLGGDASMLAQLRLGAIDFDVVTPGALASLSPLADISFLGFAFKDAAEGIAVMDGPLGSYVRAEAEARGLRPMRAIWDNGMNQIGANAHPVESPADLRGLKIRVIESRILVDLFKALGASPVPLNFADVYSALRTKLIDGEAAALVVIETSRFYEVNRYVSLTNHYWGGLWLVAGGEVWSKLPPDLAELIERKNALYAGLERRDAAALNAALADKLGRRGVAVNRVDPEPFRRILGTYYAAWRATFGAKAWGLLEGSLGRSIS